MEELKMLIGMVKDLPAMAIWVLVLFFCYKVVVIGSIWGTVKLAINKAHSYYTTPKHKLEVVDIKAKIGDMTVHRPYHLIMQLERLKGIATFGTSYIREEDVLWLEQAIDDKIENDKKPKEEKK